VVLLTRHAVVDIQGLGLRLEYCPVLPGSGFHTIDVYLPGAASNRYADDVASKKRSGRGKGPRHGISSPELNAAVSSPRDPVRRLLPRVG